jgi:hypothetical protein
MLTSFSRRFACSAIAALALATLSTATLGCGVAQQPRNASHSEIETVEIPVTKVKDQRRVGFCWSYALAAFVESLHLARTDKTVNVSEEALGFYRMAEHLHYLSKEFQGADLEEAINAEILDGYWAIQPTNPYLDAFRLVKKYGLVPDAVWSYKFGGPGDVSGDDKLASIRKAMVKLVKGRTRGTTTLDEIMSKALVASGGYPSKPPVSFDWEGNTTSAKEWARTTLRFDPDAYALMAGTSTDDFAPLVKALKRALARGIPVITSFDVYDSFVDVGDLKATGVDPADDRFQASSRHMVLVTDFANTGGRPGGMSKEQIAAEVARPASDLDFIVFKNSWGYATWSSSSRRMVEPGMYTLDKGYLRGNLRNGVFEIIVPKDIADNPDAAIVVNEEVTGSDEITEREFARTPFFGVTASELNCRAAPGIDQSILSVLAPQDVVFARGFEKDSLGQQWMNVKVGSSDDTTETSCYVRALKIYMNNRRLGTIRCPEGYGLHVVGREGGRYCMKGETQVLGPFPQDMVDKCIAWGGGEDICRNGKTWGKKLALAARGNGLCPAGSWYDFDVDYCSDGVNVYGPFPDVLVQRCIAFTGDQAVCLSGRWSQRVLFFLQRSEN